MHLNIVIRAADPARAVETLRALGIVVDTPDRPNPGRWHADGTASVSVVACEQGQTAQVALGLAVMPEGVDILTSSGHPDVAILDAGGCPIPLVIDAGPIRYPVVDLETVGRARQVIARAGAGLKTVCDQLGMRGLSLAGPQLLHRRWEPVFTLIVDGVDETKLQPIEDALRPHGDGYMRVEPRARASFDPETLRAIDRFSWPVDLE